jgi:thioredoxin reductase (NADPH)
MKKINTDVIIIGAGPVGLFAVFQLGQLGIKACLVDCLSEIGGQCSALYPEKPIYDIPAHPKVSAQELINNLKIQIEPFKPEIVLNQKVEKIVDHSDSFSVFTSNKTQIEAKCIFIAAGNGAFGPNRPPLENIYEFENKTVFYNINNKMLFKDKVVAIAGGGDSAVDWAIELSKVASKIFFIHRRDKLRAMPANVKILEKLRDKGIIEMIIPYQLDSILGKNGIIESLIVKNLDKIEKKINVDFFLPFFGLSTDLGPIKEWELELDNNILKVNQSNNMTRRDGIYGIGDVCSYPGKLKLILTGFSEAANASHHCYKRIFPEKTLHFEYSTSKGINQFSN